LRGVQGGGFLEKSPPGRRRHPTAWGPYKKLYKTGDLARWLADGNIEFLGRIDQQVKIRGYRIEPGEIEHRLLDIHGVKEAVVIDRKAESTGEKYLCAYLVLETAGPPGRLNRTELRDALSRELPGYMVPSYFVEIERIPMTPGGKLDRRCLPGPETSEAGGEYTAPGNEMEERLVRVWTGVLGKRVGIHDNFFELGGHSLNAAVVDSPGI
jgi:acyl-coenzyme A synthetase/AMP-(fatty) acid ligase